MARMPAHVSRLRLSENPAGRTLLLASISLIAIGVVIVYSATATVTDPGAWTLHTKYLRSDLFTVVFFLSEVYAVRDEAQPYLEHLFAAARPGSYFLYLDNREGRFRGWFDTLAKAFDWDVLAGDSCRMSMAYLWEEQVDDLGLYAQKFARSPRLTASVDYRICRKYLEL